MTREIEQSKHGGTFSISPDRRIYGELTLAGRDTNLYLQDKEFFSTHTLPDHCIKGVLLDLTKVTLLECITTSGTGHAYRGEDTYYFSNVFPHYIVDGDHHIEPTERIITAVNFVVDDAPTLFHDTEAFGALLDARPHIEHIVRADGPNKPVEIGAYPAILYFTGKREIFAADTALGNVSASHNPTHGMGSSRGVSLTNTIFVTIGFSTPVHFDDAISRVFVLLRYFAILVGRSQNMLKLNLRLKSDESQPIVLNVYSSMLPKRDSQDEDRGPHHVDVLLDAARQPDTFSGVLQAWVKREEDWHDARVRFSGLFENQTYSVDRLIGLANLFDILPDSAVAPQVLLSEELKHARDESIGIFRRLPPSPERDSVLSALGRVGTNTLKQKIRHRAQVVIDKVGSRFPDLVTVVDEAVNCRNHYVHGSAPSFDYSTNFGLVAFFTDSMEFVFAASDLVEAGWDIKRWSIQMTPMSHPFAQYRIAYAENLQKLKSLLT